MKNVVIISLPIRLLHQIDDPVDNRQKDDGQPDLKKFNDRNEHVSIQIDGRHITWTAQGGSSLFPQRTSTKRCVESRKEAGPVWGRSLFVWGVAQRNHIIENAI
jgi:hypothetical protein